MQIETNADIRAFLGRYQIKIMDLAETLGISRSSVFRKLQDWKQWKKSELELIRILAVRIGKAEQ